MHQAGAGSPPVLDVLLPPAEAPRAESVGAGLERERAAGDRVHEKLVPSPPRREHEPNQCTPPVQLRTFLLVPPGELGGAHLMEDAEGAAEMQVVTEGGGALLNQRLSRPTRPARHE